MTGSYRSLRAGKRGRWLCLFFVPALGMLAVAVLSSHAPGLAGATGVSSLPARAGLPRPDHVVIVIEENHSYPEIIGSSSAPYINSLASQGALFTASYAIEHPSQPNYLDLFAGSNQGVTSDSCPHSFSTANLGSELLDVGLTFAAYSENLPSPGSTVCSSGAYVRKHSPWVNFTNLPSQYNLPFSYFPTDYSTLPTLSIVIPNQNNDMHDGTIAQGDTWLQAHLNSYVQWARSHNSLFILTFDEDDFTPVNHVATVFVGPMVAQGQYSQTINHFNLLRTLEDMYDLAYAGQSGSYQPITGVWSGTPQPTATPAPASWLRAHVTWQGRPAQPSTLQALPISLTMRSGVTSVDYPLQTTDNIGTFTVTTTSLAPGQYTWRVKGPKYLARSGNVNLVQGANSVEMGQMLVGDSDNNNAVSSVDFNILRTSFGRRCVDPGYDDRAEFNGDCVVNIADFTLQKGNFGVPGAP